MNDQTCSNVLAHCGRSSIGRTRTGEAPVGIPGPQAANSRSPRDWGVLYPDLVGACRSFRPAQEVQPVAVRFDNNGEDATHYFKVGASKQIIRHT